MPGWKSISGPTLTEDERVCLEALLQTEESIDIIEESSLAPVAEEIQDTSNILTQHQEPAVSIDSQLQNLPDDIFEIEHFFDI